MQTQQNGRFAPNKEWGGGVVEGGADRESDEAEAPRPAAVGACAAGAASSTIAACSSAKAA